MRLLYTIAAVVVAVYLLICLVLFLRQRALIYFPPPRRECPAPVAQWPNGQGMVHAVVREQPGRVAVLYFGGNAEDVSCTLPMLSRAFPQQALYLLLYPGYGGTPGAPSEASLQAAALGLYEAVSSRHADLIVVGRSLGSGVAAFVAAQRPVTRLALVTPYDTLVEVAATHWPLVPVRYLMRDRFDSARRVANLKVPTLLLLAETDDVVPRASSLRLAASFAPGVATLRVLPGTDHITISGSPDYVAALAGLAN